MEIFNEKNVQYVVTKNKREVHAVYIIAGDAQLKAKAICHSEDDFDANFGMDLALERVRVKFETRKRENLLKDIQKLSTKIRHAELSLKKKQKQFNLCELELEVFTEMVQFLEYGI